MLEPCICRKSSKRLNSRPFQTHPGRGMVAGSGLTAYPGVHAGINQLGTQSRIKQKMIDPKTRVLLPMLPKIIPESVHPLVGETGPHRIAPALRQQPLVTLLLQEGDLAIETAKDIHHLGKSAQIGFDVLSG